MLDKTVLKPLFYLCDFDYKIFKSTDKIATFMVLRLVAVVLAISNIV